MRPTTVLFWVLVVAVPWAWYRLRRAPLPEARTNKPDFTASQKAAGEEPSAAAARPEAEGVAPVPPVSQQKSAAEQELQALAGEGVRLLKESESDQALLLFDRALGALGQLAAPSVDLEQSLHFHRGRALEQLKRHEEALAEYQTCQAERFTTRTNPWPQLAAFHQGGLLLSLSRRQAGIDLLRLVLERRPHLPGPMQLEAFHLVASAYFGSGDHAQGLRFAEQGALFAQKNRQPVSEARMLRVAARCQMALGRPDDALITLQRELDLYRLGNHARGQVDVKREIARLYQATGEWLKAFTWLRACLDDEEASEDKGAEARLCYDIACLSIDQGSLVEAGMFLQRSLALFRQVEDRQGIDEAGRTMMGLTVLIHRLATADMMTYRDIERGVKSSDPGKE